MKYELMIVVSHGSFNNELATFDGTIEEQQLDSEYNVNDKQFLIILIWVFS